MVDKSLKELISKEGWKDGSTWEFDWYIDLIFCHAMAFGKNPFELKYYQPILDDEFLNSKINNNIIEKNKEFFKNRQNVLN